MVHFHPRKVKTLLFEIRLDTLDALDDLKELSSAEELKNKLLFSVVVVSIIFILIFFLQICQFPVYSKIVSKFLQLSFRSVLQSIALVRQQVAAVLQVEIQILFLTLNKIINLMLNKMISIRLIIRSVISNAE